jgi:hypothetical protein
MSALLWVVLLTLAMARAAMMVCRRTRTKKPVMYQGSGLGRRRTVFSVWCDCSDGGSESGVIVGASENRESLSELDGEFDIFSACLCFGLT